MRLVLVLALVACGSPAPPPATPSGPPAAFEPVTDDVVVAQVDGRPVYGSCVAAQARHTTRDRALEECIDFELMAQAAERRGLARDADVVLETRRALVNQVVAKEYEAVFTKPADFGETWDRLYARNRIVYDHDEQRASAYVRVTVPKNAPADVDAAAHALAEEIATAAAPETGLMPPQFFDLATRVAGGRKIDHAKVTPRRKETVDPPYGDALFSIADVGRTAPHAVRTHWGWDVILLDGIEPAVHPGEAEIAAKLLPDVQRSYFYTWTERVARSLGIKVEVVKDNIGKLEDVK